MANTLAVRGFSDQALTGCTLHTSGFVAFADKPARAALFNAYVTLNNSSRSIPACVSMPLIVPPVSFFKIQCCGLLEVFQRFLR